MNYTNYLKQQINRLENIKKYCLKRDSTRRPERKDYYSAGIRMLLQNGETLDNYSQIMEEYKTALQVRKQRISDLYKEIRIVKKLKV